MVLIQKEGSPGEDLVEPVCTLLNTTQELHKGICQQVSNRDLLICFRFMIDQRKCFLNSKHCLLVYMT